MGKYILLLTFSVGLGLTYYAQQSQQTSVAASEDQAERQETVLARQIARSAFERGVSSVKQGLGSYKDQTGVKYEGGEFDVLYSVPTPEQDTINGIRWRFLNVTAIGRYPDTTPQKTYQITAKARQAISDDVNAITAGGDSVEFLSNGPGCEGCIDGYDEGGGEARSGISLPQGGDADAVCEEFKRNENHEPITGAGDGCSVKTRSEDRDDDVDRMMDAMKSRILDSEDSDKVQIYDKGFDGEPDTYPTENDPGILYVKDAGGKENGKGIKISEDFNGLVFVREDEQVTLNGNHSIKGGLLMEGNSKYRLNGGGTGGNVDYHTERLLKLVDVLPMLGEPVEITDRNGRLVSSTN